jgi:hypothetical protein
MSERDTAPDPVDAAYVSAEALLEDHGARAARRARVLGAIASDPKVAPTRPPAPRQHRRSWRGGRWLAAASVAGLATFVALRLDPPLQERQRSSSADSAATAAPPDVIASAPAEFAPPAAPAPAPVAVAPDIAAEAEERARGAAVTAEPSPRLGPSPQAAPPPLVAPPAAPAMEAAAADSSAVVVTRGRAGPLPATASARSAPSQAVVGSTATAPAASAARLREAAAAGRTGELTSLLDQGARIDDPDDKGETALMKSVRANQPDAAAVLLRRGANLDRKNHAGVSARAMAAAMGDPELNRVLELAP